MVGISFAQFRLEAWCLKGHPSDLVDRDGRLKKEEER